MIEFLLIAPILVLSGLGIVQMGLVYHAQTILNHATFEAARVGAVNHALPTPMRQELGRRLAAHEGGDGSAQSIARAVVQSQHRALDETTTRLRLLNPTREAFDDWAVHDDEAQGLAIPNVHLRHHDPLIRGHRSGLNLQAANLLEIEVLHGYRPRVPLASRLFVQALALVDRDHAGFYERGLLPLKSTSRVRMHSEAWEQSLAAAAPTESSTDTHGGEQPGEVSIPPGTVEVSDCLGNHGLASLAQLASEDELFMADCPDTLGTPAGGTDISIPPPADSVDCMAL